MKPALHFPRFAKNLLAAALVATFGIAGFPAEAKTPKGSALATVKSKVAQGADAKALREEFRIMHNYCETDVTDRLEAVRFLLDSGMGVNQKDVNGVTPLEDILGAINSNKWYDNGNCEAVQEENNKIAMLLVSRGADMNVSVHDSGFKGSYNTAFETALMYGSANLVQIMIENGAKVNAVEGDITPLHRAWRADIAKVLLDNGAKVDAKDFQGNTPLMSSVGNTDTVRLLIERGANVNAVNKKGETALTMAQEAQKNLKGAWQKLTPAQRADKFYQENLVQINEYDKVISILKEAGAKAPAGGKKGAKKR
ncbi:MAG: ankyrin repeat domain-containing protein [Ottowia sp.]|nr:ankyrin repeat domain-containing protein [Ottowia sp.]